MSALLSATELCVRYNTRVVLDNATLAIHPQDRIGMVGRNGCGKTTFLRILAGQQLPDSGRVASRRDTVIGYLPQECHLDASRNVLDNITAGAQSTLDLIAEFESLPADSPRHEELEHRIAALDGWALDSRIATAMSHLNCPAGERVVASLSGGERRRVALCRAIVSRPDVLILDEPTNHLDLESIEWLATYLENLSSAFLVVTHDRYFLDRVTGRMVELSEGRFFSHDGNYTDYLLAKAERQAAEATVEHKRQMLLKRELAWVRQGARARRGKAKNRFDRYDELAAQAAPNLERDMDLCIPPPRPLGNRIVDVNMLGMELGGRGLFSDFTFSFEKGQRVGVIGANGTGKTTLLRILVGEARPTGGSVRIGELTVFNYIDQGRLKLNEERTLLEEIADGTEFVQWGGTTLSLRGYLRRFLFSDECMDQRVKDLSGGERSRLLLALILKRGGNFLLLDEPTNDLDLSTLRVLEEALMAFPGVVVVVSHDRYFLNRVCTNILAFEGGRIAHSVGDYDYYWEKKRRAASRVAVTPRRDLSPGIASSGSASSKPRKLTWKEAEELEGMEQQILVVEERIARIEEIFATPDFHRVHGAQTESLTAELASHKDELTRLYGRWEELEAVKLAWEKSRRASQS